MGEVRIAVPGAGELQGRHHMGAPFVVARRPTTQAAGDGALGGVVIVSQRLDTTPAILREVERSTTNHVKYKLT